jgi:hypothetical protein
MEAGAFAFLAFCIYLSIMPFRYFPTKRQAYPGTFILVFRIQAIKYTEHLFSINRIESDSVIRVFNRNEVLL